MYSTPIIPQEFEWCVTSTISHETADRWQSQPPQSRTGIVTIHYRGTTHVVFDFRTLDRILGLRTYDGETMSCSRGSSSAARVGKLSLPAKLFSLTTHLSHINNRRRKLNAAAHSPIAEFCRRFIDMRKSPHSQKPSVSGGYDGIQAFRFCQIKPAVQNLNTAVRPHTTLRNLLVHPKDRISNEEKPEVVYKIPCKNCERVYVGETGRPLGARVKAVSYTHLTLPTILRV